MNRPARSFRTGRAKNSACCLVQQRLLPKAAYLFDSPLDHLLINHGSNPERAVESFRPPRTGNPVPRVATRGPIARLPAGRSHAAVDARPKSECPGKLARFCEPREHPTPGIPTVSCRIPKFHIFFHIFAFLNVLAKCPALPQNCIGPERIRGIEKFAASESHPVQGDSFSPPIHTPSPCRRPKARSIGRCAMFTCSGQVQPTLNRCEGQASG